METFGFPSKDRRIVDSDKKKQWRVYWQCKICRRDYSYVGNASSMWQHLEESHIEEYHQAKEESKDASPSEPLKHKEEPDSAQPTFPQVFQAKNLYPWNSTRWKTLTDAVCLFIARDMHPYQTINDVGFQHSLCCIPLTRDTALQTGKLCLLN